MNRFLRAGRHGGKSREELAVTWVERIEQDGRNLSAWEDDFIEQMRTRIDSGRALSDEQIEKVEEIYTERVP